MPSTPTGARLETNGFASILEAPPSSPEPRAERPNPAGGDAGFYARDRNISTAEAQRRIDAQHRIMPEFERLQQRLRASEAGNYTDARMIHDPDWAYVFYFKRDPQATLAKYASNPRFKSARATYSQAELEAILKPWRERLEAENMLGGFGTDATFGTIDMMLSVTEEEYRAIAARKGWGPTPAALKLGFAGALPFPAIDPRVTPFFRGFGQEPRSTVFQLEALGGGRIILRDGCLRMVGHDGSESLAFFHRETGLGLDPQGYLALVDRATGRAKGRIGEIMSWGGPNAVPANDPAVAALKAQCGDLPIVNVGNPESSARFNARYSRN
ncbi:MAG: hypothetical protein ABIS23_02655 [Sphingomicrobium sp.]